MRRTISAAVLATALTFSSTNARALTVPTGTTDGQFIVAIAGVLTALFLPAIQAERRAALRGSLTLDLQEIARRSNNFANGQRGDVLFGDILDFDLTIDVPTDATNGSAMVSLTPDTGAIEIVNPGWITDGQTLIIDSAGVVPGTPIVQFTVDRFDDQIAFPNGRRIGEDANDILLAQLFTGSVNFGVAALPDGFFGDPALVGATQLTPDDEFVFGEAANVSAIPLPATAPMLIGALGAFWVVRRRRTKSEGHARAA